MRLGEASEATGARLAVAAATLADGFRHDPVITWIMDPLPDPTEAMARWWAAHVEPVPAGARVLVDRRDRTAAIWHEPRGADEERDDGRRLAEVLVEVLGEETAYAKLGALKVVGDAHPAGPPHWYLAAVATRRTHQGTGCAPAVITPVLDHCDDAGLPAYLESSNSRNVGFYERLGFSVTGEVVVPDGPTLTPMWREPR